MRIKFNRINDREYETLIMVGSITYGSNYTHCLLGCELEVVKRFMSKNCNIKYNERIYNIHSTNIVGNYYIISFENDSDDAFFSLWSSDGFEI